MRPNIFLTIISVLLTALLGYWVYYMGSDSANKWVYLAGSTVCLCCTLVPGLGLKYESKGIGVNIRVLSFLFFAIFLVLNLVFAGCGTSVPTYVIVNGVLLLIFLAVLYKMQCVKGV